MLQYVTLVKTEETYFGKSYIVWLTVTLLRTLKLVVQEYVTIKVLVDAVFLRTCVPKRMIFYCYKSSSHMHYFTGVKIPRKNILLVCKQETHSQNRSFLDLVQRLILLNVGWWTRFRKRRLSLWVTYRRQSLELNKQLYSTWKLIALHKVYTFIEPLSFLAVVKLKHLWLCWNY